MNDKDDHSCSRRFNYQCQKNNERRDGIFSGTFDTAVVDSSKTAVRPVSSDTVQFALLIPRRYKTRFESDNETHSRTGKGAFRGIYVDLELFGVSIHVFFYPMVTTNNYSWFFVRFVIRCLEFFSTDFPLRSETTIHWVTIAIYIRRMKNWLWNRMEYQIKLNWLWYL